MENLRNKFNWPLDIKYEVLIFVLIFASSLAIFHSELFLTWDSSFQLYTQIKYKTPFVISMRYIQYLQKIPVYIYLKRVGEDYSIKTVINILGIYFFLFNLVLLFVFNFTLKHRKDAYFFVIACAFFPTAIFTYHPLAEHLQLTTISWVILSLLVISPEKFILQLFFIAIAFFTHPASVIFFIALGFMFVTAYLIERKANDFYAFLLLCSIGVLRGYLILRVPGDKNYTTSETINLIYEDIVSHWTLLSFVILLMPILIHAVISFIIYLKRDKISYVLISIVPVFMFAVYSHMASIINVAILRHFMIFLHLPLMMYFFYLFKIKKMKFNDTFFANVSICALFCYSAIVVFFSYFRLNQMQTTYEAHKNNKNCIEYYKLEPDSLPYGHFGAQYEWLFFYKRKKIPFVVLSNFGDCNAAISDENLKFTLWDKTEESISPYFFIERLNDK